MQQSNPGAPRPPPAELTPGNFLFFLSYGYGKFRGTGALTLSNAPKTELNLWPDEKCANVFYHRRF